MTGAPAAVVVGRSKRRGLSVKSIVNDGRSRPVAIWLFAVAALVLAMVVVGGATRLTGSGLSITQWKPVSGALPPMTDQAWARAFGQYRATPQYRLVNAGMSLGEFQFIYWWEWAHRLFGRAVGAAFAVPFVAFLAAADALPGRLIWRCVLLLGLGGLQGLVGWWMVKSGLEARVSVAPRAAGGAPRPGASSCSAPWSGRRWRRGRGQARTIGLATAMAGRSQAGLWRRECSCNACWARWWPATRPAS